MLISKLFNGAIFRTDNFILGGIPDSIRPARVLGVKGVIDVLVGWCKLYFFLLILSVF